MSTAAYHEGFNMAAVLEAPLILVGENNGWAYSTPTSSQTKAPSLCDRARGYGVPAESVDGNDPIAVVEATRRAAEHCRAGKGPYFLEAVTMRMRGHAEHDDAGYVPAEMLEEWKRRDPLETYRRRLLDSGWASEEKLAAIEQDIHDVLEKEVAAAEASELPDPAGAFGGVFAGEEPAPHKIPRQVEAWLAAGHGGAGAGSPVLEHARRVGRYSGGGRG
jgi:TPP-dependent pyruvate/acetoin dehydrogenase alpha subunit